MHVQCVGDLNNFVLREQGKWLTSMVTSADVNFQLDHLFILVPNGRLRITLPRGQGQSLSFGESALRVRRYSFYILLRDAILMLLFINIDGFNKFSRHLYAAFSKTGPRFEGI